MKDQHLLGRRGFFRLGAFAALATAASPLIGRDQACARPAVCNPEAPAPQPPRCSLNAGQCSLGGGAQTIRRKIGHDGRAFDQPADPVRIYPFLL